MKHGTKHTFINLVDRNKKIHGCHEDVLCHRLYFLKLVINDAKSQATKNGVATLMHLPKGRA